MGFMKIITDEGVQDIETMTVEQLLGLQVAFMAEKDKQFFFANTACRLDKSDNV